MPLCLRNEVGSIPQMTLTDISFALTTVIHAVHPPNRPIGPITGTTKAATETRTGSLTYTGTRDTKINTKINVSLYQVAFLALKIIVICFESELNTEWMFIARTMRELGKRNEAHVFLWDFLEFVVTHRTTLYIILYPYIYQKLSYPPISELERQYHAKIREKIKSHNFPKCRGAILMELAHRMKELKEELEDSSESTETEKKQEPTVHVTSETAGKHPRHSLIGLFTGEGKFGTDHLHGLATQRESSTSTSHVSTPNQGTTNSILEGNESQKDTPTPVNEPTHDRSSRRSSVNEDHGTQLHKSESFIAQKVHKLRFVSSVEFRHSSGETSITPLSPSSPVDESSGENQANRSKLQRIKPQSRKTFRFRRSRKNNHGTEVSHVKLTNEEETSKPSSPIASTSPQVPQEQLMSAPADPHRLRIATRLNPTEGSWDEDSAISQTSSTSGYKEAYPVMHLKEPLESSPKTFPPLASPDFHDLPSTSSATTANNFMHGDNSSPDCSLNENGEKTALLSQADRSSSQQSLWVVFDQQDETTLI